MVKKKIVWQADVFALIAPSGGGEIVRAPAGLVFDPHEPFILASRVYPEGCEDSVCLQSAVAEAMFTYGVTPTEVHVRWGKHKALEALAAKMSFSIMVCDELAELAAVKEDMAKYMRSAFDALRAGAARSTV